MLAEGLTVSSFTGARFIQDIQEAIVQNRAACVKWTLLVYGNAGGDANDLICTSIKTGCLPNSRRSEVLNPRSPTRTSSHVGTIDNSVVAVGLKTFCGDLMHFLATV